MKVKLLKKVRKNYRIIKDGHGNYTVERFYFFFFLIFPAWGWENINSYTKDTYPSIQDAIAFMRADIRRGWWYLTRKHKVEQMKLKQRTKVWYND